METTLMHVDKVKKLFDKKMPFFYCCPVLSADYTFLNSDPIEIFRAIFLNNSEVLNSVITDVVGWCVQPAFGHVKRGF